jgi:predicted RNA binding protein YcfA (HicA-like mRNA interferase family)
MKVRDVIKRIKSDGWYYDYTNGDHQYYRHATKPGKVTVPGHPSDEVRMGTLMSIWRQAGLEKPR